MAASTSETCSRRSIGVALALMLTRCGHGAQQPPGSGVPQDAAPAESAPSGHVSPPDAAEPDTAAVASSDATLARPADLDAWSPDVAPIGDGADGFEAPEAPETSDALDGDVASEADGDGTSAEAGVGAGADAGASDLCSTRGCPSNWWTFGYDSSHSGYNPAELGVPPMTGQWATTIASPAALSPACAEEGRAFVTYGAAGSASKMVAIGLSDGSVLWTHDFGAVSSVGHPTVVRGTVYVQTNKGLGANATSNLWALDATSGDVRWAAPFDSQFDNFWAPTVGGSAVYIDGGRYGGLYGFRVADGTQMFFYGGLYQADSWTPGFHAGVLYSYVQGAFVAHDPASGSLLWNNTIRGTFAPYSTNAAAAFDKQAAYVIAPPQLAEIDLVTQDVTWITSAAYDGTPAIADGVVYAIGGGELLAVDAATGSSSFSFAGDKKLKYPPVVANGFVYASSAGNAYAVNLATQAQAWSAAPGGWLSIASGRLIVAGADGILRGFALSSGLAPPGDP